jgi:hypothetical protein
MAALASIRRAQHTRCQLLFGRPAAATPDKYPSTWAACGLHDARLTAATTLLLIGVPERAVMDFIGWSNAAMIKQYAHVTETKS